MARISRTIKTARPAARRRAKVGTITKLSKTPAKARATRKPATTAKRGSVGRAAAPKVSKDELRAEVERLTRANVNLRAKNKEADREAKSAAARIAELEDQVARLGQQMAPQPSGAGEGEVAPAPKTRRGPRRRKIDPGDAVPPEVAVEQAESPDPEAETARENLEEHFGGK
jgi:hypothetical protein